MATCNFLNKEPWVVYFTLLAPKEGLDVWKMVSWCSVWHFFDFLTPHTLGGHNFLISNPFWQCWMLQMHQENSFNFSFYTINKRTLLWIFISSKFLCVWTPAYLICVPLKQGNLKVSTLQKLYNLIKSYQGTMVCFYTS